MWGIDSVKKKVGHWCTRDGNHAEEFHELQGIHLKKIPNTGIKKDCCYHPKRLDPPPPQYIEVIGWGGKDIVKSTSILESLENPLLQEWSTNICQSLKNLDKRPRCWNTNLVKNPWSDKNWARFPNNTLIRESSSPIIS